MKQPDETAVSLEPRKKPTQKRSQKRVDGILDACALLLDEIGPDGVNTNTIADRAGIPVSSLYQYFPNKHAVLIELMRRQLREIDRAGQEIARKVSPETHWTEICDRVLEDYLAFCRKLPGFTSLWHTIQAHPELYQTSSGVLLDQLVSMRGLLSAYFALHAPGEYSETEIRSMQRIAIEAVIPVIGRAARAEAKEQEQIMRDAKLLARGYLGCFMPD